MKLVKKIRQTLFGTSVLVGSGILSFAAIKSTCGTSAAMTGSSCDVTALQAQLKTQMTSGAQIFYSGAAIIGIALVIIGLLKLKAHSMDTQGTSGHLRAAIWLLIIGALLIAVPVIMMLGASSIMGGSSVTLPSESSIFTSAAAPAAPPGT